MQQARDDLLASYRAIQESSESIRRAALLVPETRPLGEQLIALNDAVAEFIAEVDFLAQRGLLTAEVVQWVRLNMIQPVLNKLVESGGAPKTD